MSNDPIDFDLSQLGLWDALKDAETPEELYTGATWSEDLLEIADAAFAGTAFLLNAVGALDVNPDNLDDLEKLLTASANSMVEMVIEASGRYGLNADSTPNS